MSQGSIQSRRKAASSSSLSYNSSSKKTQLLGSLLSAEPEGLLRVLLSSLAGTGMKYKYQLHLRFFPAHAQIYIQRESLNVAYMQQFFNLLTFGTQAIVRRQNDIYILVTQEEYFLIVFLHVLTRLGVSSSVR